MMSTVKRSPDARKIAPGDDSFAARFRDAVGTRGTTDLAKAVSTAPSTLYRYFDGAIPAADIAIRLARELDVSVEWLIEGVGERQRSLAGADADQVTLPRYDLAAIEQDGKDPVGELSFPRVFLSGLRSPAGVWLAFMPSDAMRTVAGEGDLIVCADPETPLQDRRIYVFNFDGNLIVRRVSVRPDGLILKGDADDDTIVIRPDQAETLFPVARVLGPLGFNPA